MKNIVLKQVGFIIWCRKFYFILNLDNHYLRKTLFPLFFIFKQKRLKTELLFGAPLGSGDSVRSKAGYLWKYLKKNQRNTNLTPDKPHFLLVNNHSTQILRECINFRRGNEMMDCNLCLYITF